MTQADQLAKALEDLLMFTAEQDANQGDPDTDHPSVTAAMQALAAYRAQADKQGEAVACVLEFGAVSLPVGDSSRITEFEIHKDIASAVAAGSRCGFDWRVYASPPQVAQPLTVEQIHEIWQLTPCESMATHITSFARAIEAAHGIKE